MLKIYLKAEHSILNVARFYSICLTQDLFGDWTLRTTYGRIGTNGRQKVYTFKTPQDALPKIQWLLNRRAMAPKRLGCHYQLIEIYQDSFLPAIVVPDILKISSAKIPETPVRRQKITCLPLFDH